MSTAAPDLRVLTTRLQRVHGLSDGDRSALERLPLRTSTVPAGHNIAWSGEPTDRCTVVLQGMAFAYKVTGEGGRQIVGLHLAGDLPDLQGLRSRRADANVAAVTDCHVGFLTHRALVELCSSRPGLADVLWREMWAQAAILREWLLNLGRREARVRVAHLLCEVVARHRMAGLTETDDCSFPFTQIMTADALGLSAVHVNRVVKRLRQDGLITWDGRHLAVHGWERLQMLADFDPVYLCPDRSPSTV